MKERVGKYGPDTYLFASRNLSRPRRPSPQRPREPHVILFLASNPSGTTRLALDEECAEIEREIAMTPARDDFDFRSKWAVSVDEVMRCLNMWHPTIIHFSGHGASSPGLHPLGAAAAPPRAPAPRRDLEPAAPGAAGAPAPSAAGGRPGLYLQDTCVTGSALAMMITSAAPSARVLVLNACSSDALAESLRSEVDCVVSMSGDIGDTAARSFAVGFYRALGNGRSVGNAVKQGVAMLAARQLPDEHQPVCRTRDGVDAEALYLHEPDAPWP